MSGNEPQPRPAGSPLTVEAPVPPLELAVPVAALQTRSNSASCALLACQQQAGQALIFTSRSAMTWDISVSGARSICTLLDTESLRSNLQQRGCEQPVSLARQKHQAARALQSA